MRAPNYWMRFDRVSIDPGIFRVHGMAVPYHEPHRHRNLVVADLANVHIALYLVHYYMWFDLNNKFFKEIIVIINLNNSLRMKSEAFAWMCLSVSVAFLFATHHMHTEGQRLSNCGA